MEISAQTLIEQTYNFYGHKADLAKAIEFLKNRAGATPGSFYEWVTTGKVSPAW